MVCPTAVLRAALVAGFPNRQHGSGGSPVWGDGAPILSALRLGNHAQSCPRDLATSGGDAHHHAVDQVQDKPRCQSDFGPYQDVLWQDESFDHWVGGTTGID